MPAFELAKTNFFSDSSLVAYYQLESSGSDSKGSNTLTGTAPTFTTGRFGNGGSFASASSQYLNGSTFAGSSSWSVSFWYKPGVTNADQYLVSKDDVSTKRIFGFLHDNANQMTLYAWGTGQAFHQTTSAASGMSAGTWYMWTGVWNATNNLVTLYKNGASWQTFALTGNQSADTTSNNLTLGRQNAGSPGLYLNGMLDDVSIFSRALTAREIQQIYQGRSYGEFNPN